MKNKWNVIGSYIYGPLMMMSAGTVWFIPFLIIILGITSVLTSQGWEVAGYRNFGLLLSYVFSVGLFATYCQRKENETTRSRILSLEDTKESAYGTLIEIDSRISKLIDNLEELAHPNHNVDLDTIDLINNTRRELADIRDKLF